MNRLNRSEGLFQNAVKMITSSNRIIKTKNNNQKKIKSRYKRETKFYFI